jgi:hypothetical protein
MVTSFLSKDYQTLVNHTRKVLRPSALTALLEVDFTVTSPHHKILDLPTRKSKIEEPKFSPMDLLHGVLSRDWTQLDTSRGR